VAKGKISIYTVNVNFSNIVAFKGMIRKFSNMVADHTEWLSHPPIFDTFSCQHVPLNNVNTSNRIKDVFTVAYGTFKSKHAFLGPGSIGTHIATWGLNCGNRRNL
jgi:hypothetical protein